MPHLLETAIGGVNAAANDAEAFALHLLAEQIVLGKENPLMKSSEFPKLFQIKQHEHSSSEGVMEKREILKQIVRCVKHLVDPAAIAAKDIRGHAMKLLTLRQLHGAANYGRMSQFDIGIEKKNVVAFGLGRAKVAPDGRHAAPDDVDIQAVAEPHHNFGSAIRRVCISYQHSRTRHLRVVLIHQRSQQARNQLRLVLGWNHDRQFVRGIHGFEPPVRRR